MVYVKIIKEVVSDGERFCIGDSVIVTMKYNYALKRKVYCGIISAIADNFFFLECDGRSEPLEIFQIEKVEKNISAKS